MNLQTSPLRGILIAASFLVGGFKATNCSAQSALPSPAEYTIDSAFIRPQFKRGPEIPFRATSDGSGNILVRSDNDEYASPELNNANDTRMDGILRINGTTGALDTTFSASPVLSVALGAAVQA